MPIGNTLKQILAQFLQQVGPSISDSYNARYNPEFYQQNQENKRQQAAQQFQQHLRNTITPYEQAQLAAQAQARQDTLNFHRQQQDDLERQRAEARDLATLNLFASGNVREARGPQVQHEAYSYQDPVQGVPDIFNLPQFKTMIRPTGISEGDTNGVVEYNGKKLVAIPPGEREGMFTFTPDDEDLKNYRWLPAKGVTMPVKEFPNFVDSLGKLHRNSPAMRAGQEQYLHGQVDQLTDPSDPLRSIYKSQVSNYLKMGTPQGDMQAAGVLDDIRRVATQTAAEKRRLSDQFSPTAIAGHANIAAATEEAKKRAEVQRAYDDNATETFPRLWKEIKRGAFSPDQVTTRFGQAFKEAFQRYVSAEHPDEPYPVPLAPQAQKDLTVLEPVKAGVDRFVKFMETPNPELGGQAPKNLKGPGLFFKDRAMYALGINDGRAGLVSEGEFNALRGAAQISQGLSRAVSVLDKAAVHTPNFWKDSGDVMYDKIKVMQQTLQDREDAIYKFGAKTGVVQGSGATPPVSTRPPLVVPPPPRR